MGKYAQEILVAGTIARARAMRRAGVYKRPYVLRCCARARKILIRKVN